MLLEIFVIVVAVVLIYKLAEADINSGALWGVITAAACGASLFVFPFPFIRVFAVAVVVFVAMFIHKAVIFKG